MNPGLAGILAGAFAAAGRALGWLTGGGALAAAAVGTLVIAGSGLRGAALLALFFASGSLLTRISSGRKPARTARQVVANGTWAALGAALNPASAAGWPLLAGALAAAQADTWATEIGAFSRRPARLLTTGAVVPSGTSGAVTPRGTLGGAAGAAAMGVLAFALGASTTTAVAAVAGGLAGFMTDSLLGATVQSRYRCDACGAEIETALHTCGRSTELLCGWRWLNNDAVNFLSTGSGAAAAYVVWLAAKGLARTAIQP